jgi:hypothetical protein
MPSSRRNNNNTINNNNNNRGSRFPLPLLAATLFIFAGLVLSTITQSTASTFVASDVYIGNNTSNVDTATLINGSPPLKAYLQSHPDVWVGPWLTCSNGVGCSRIKLPCDGVVSTGNWTETGFGQEQLFMCGRMKAMREVLVAGGVLGFLGE